MAERTRAGENELRFAAAIRAKAPEVALQGKRRFVSGNVEISVDQSLLYEDREYLIEIDSGNMAKLLVGQYVLLNQLHTQRQKPPFFLVVHTYKRYNPERTLTNLQLVNEQVFCGNGIPFGAIHYSSLSAWAGGFKSLLSLVAMPSSCVKR